MGMDCGLQRKGRDVNFEVMSNEVQTVPESVVFRRAGIKETAVLLAVAWLIPFMVHLLPWSGDRPLGAHLLPMFWAAFAAVYLFGLRTGLIVGLFTPVINLLVTGLPVARWQLVLVFELIIFALVTWRMVRKTPRLWLVAPMGYVAAKAASTLVQLVAAPFGDIGEPGTFWIESLRNGLPGLAVLLVVNAALVRMYPKQRDEGSNDAPAV